MKIVILQILLVLCFYSESNSQETILTAGKDASGSGGSASYSIGQVTYLFNASSAGSEAQGVQQPYEISVVQIVKNANIRNFDKTNFTESSSSTLVKSDDEKFIDLKFMAYPNPTKIGRAHV